MVWTMCVLCRLDLFRGIGVVALACGHMYHHACFQNIRYAWFFSDFFTIHLFYFLLFCRDNLCPYCRQAITRIIRVFPNEYGEDEEEEGPRNRCHHQQHTEVYIIPLHWLHVLRLRRLHIYIYRHRFLMRILRRFRCRS